MNSFLTVEVLAFYMVYTDVKPEHKTKPSEDSVIASGSPKTTEHYKNWSHQRENLTS